MAKKSSLFTIFLIVAIGLLGFSLFIPLLPYYADTFGATTFQNGLLISSYAAAQLIGAPLLGRASDRYGRKPVLLLSIGGTIVAFILLAYAQSLWMLFFARMLDGFTGGNISVAQAYISDVTDEKNRAKGLGLIGAAFGLGFIFGPALGGALSVYGYAAPALLAAGLSLVSFLGVIFYLPESLSPQARAELAKKAREEFSLRLLWNALRRPLMGPLLQIRFLFGLAFSTFNSIFPLYAQIYLHLQANQTGYILGYFGLLIVLVQGVGISYITARISESKLIFWSNILLGLTLLGWAIFPNLASILILGIPLALSGGILSTIINSSLTKIVPTEEIGGTLGLSTSLESLTRTIAPTAGGWLLGALGSWGPGIFGALAMAGAVIISGKLALPGNNIKQERSES